MYFVVNGPTRFINVYCNFLALILHTFEKPRILYAFVTFLSICYIERFVYVIPQISLFLYFFIMLCLLLFFLSKIHQFILHIKFNLPCIFPFCLIVHILQMLVTILLLPFANYETNLCAHQIHFLPNVHNNIRWKVTLILSPGRYHSALHSSWNINNSLLVSILPNMFALPFKFPELYNSRNIET